MLTQRKIYGLVNVLFGTGLPFDPFNFLYCFIGGMSLTMGLGFVSSSFLQAVLSLGFLGTLLAQVLLCISFGVLISLFISVFRPVFFLVRGGLQSFWQNLPVDNEKPKRDFIRLIDGVVAEVEEDTPLFEKRKKGRL